MKSARDVRSYVEYPHVRVEEGGIVRSGLAALLVSAIMCTMVAVADPAGSAFLLPSSNVMWRTAPSATFEVPVFMPPGASSATLVVAGYKYSREYTDIADGMFALSLPVADSPDGENVYNLTLTFNDPLATTQQAKLAVVQGAATGGTAAAEVRTAGSDRWSGVRKKAVLPILSGVDAVSVNGAAVDADLWESPGWFLLAARPDTAYDVWLSSGGCPFAEAILQGATSGLTIIIR